MVRRFDVDNIHVGLNAPTKRDPSSDDDLMLMADRCVAEKDYARACSLYCTVLERNGANSRAANGLGVALCRLGKYGEAERYFRVAVALQPNYPEAHNNLGFALRMLGRYAHAEASIRRAASSEAIALDVKINLGMTLLLLDRPREAEDCFTEVLKIDPDHPDALVGRGHVARFEGRFSDAESLFRRAGEIRPRIAGIWAVLASLRKMTRDDQGWLRRAEEIVASGVTSTEESELRFAIGKYWDDIGDFDRAFESFRRANELLRSTARKYDRPARVAFVQDMERIYTREAIARAKSDGLHSTRPLFVVGMPRSGTSLLEQIISSHPAVKGAGELGFWTEVLLEHVAAIRQNILPDNVRRHLGQAYLQLLAGHSVDAQYVVDKAPINAELLGVIYSVFPNARIIYMQRNAIDTCLSCYFSHLPAALSYTMDLADLAHYYRTHQRLIKHWRSVLPAETFLTVSYQELVVDLESSVRKVLEFLGLAWDERCLRFHEAKRTVSTSSNWQVRQKIYQSSLERWRNYSKFIGPLAELDELN